MNLYINNFYFLVIKKSFFFLQNMHLYVKQIAHIYYSLLNKICKFTQIQTLLIIVSIKLNSTSNFLFLLKLKMHLLDQYLFLNTTRYKYNNIVPMQ